MAENAKITIHELADIIGITARTVEKHVAILKNEGKIQRIGSDKTGHWSVINNKMGFNE